MIPSRLEGAFVELAPLRAGGKPSCLRSRTRAIWRSRASFAFLRSEAKNEVIVSAMIFSSRALSPPAVFKRYFVGGRPDRRAGPSSAATSSQRSLNVSRDAVVNPNQLQGASSEPTE